jgi:hypothetical protein
MLIPLQLTEAMNCPVGPFSPNGHFDAQKGSTILGCRIGAPSQCQQHQFPWQECRLQIELPVWCFGIDPTKKVNLLVLVFFAFPNFIQFFGVYSPFFDAMKGRPDWYRLSRVAE